MTFGARILFGVSLAANSVGLYLLGRPAPLPVEASSARDAAPALPALVPQRGGDVHAYLDTLLARGLALEETKPLLLARLVREAMPAVQGRGADEYWRSDFTAGALGRLRARHAAADRVRSVLAMLYGPQASRDPAFRQLFAPLDERYAFLEPEQQRALQKFQLERQLGEATSAKAPSAAVGAPRPPARTAGTAELEHELAALLGSAAAKQYLYRFSPLAEQLRAANLELSEPQFGAAFDRLTQLEAAPADAKTFSRVRTELRNVLGQQRFTRLWATRDPLFDVLARAARTQSLSETTLLSVYALFNDAQDRLAAAAQRYAAVDPPRAGAEMRAIQADMQQRLADLVGEDAGRALVRATTDFSVAMRRQATTNLRE